VLAAAAVGLAMGLPLAVVVEALEATEPYAGRMCPVIREDGLTFIQDDRKSPLWTIPPALEFMREARADRKIVVLGTISDYRGDAGRKYVKVARDARAVADYVFFVGPWASRCLRARRHAEDHTLRAFATAADATAYLQGELRSGDLVLIKGSRRTDRLDEIVKGLMQPSSSGAAVRARSDRAPAGADAARPSSRAMAVVGLGNAGPEFEGTRHNVGHRVLDELARALGISWTRHDDMLIARMPGPGSAVHLVKPLTAVNFTGSVLARASRHLGFGAADCILVHDDISVAVGVTRVRMRGSDGGHRGVRSILQAFQSDAFPRVKVGVGQPERKSELAEYVLAAFSPVEQVAIEKACAEASAQVLRLIREHRAATADGS
jgi:aminoacyl-tRNA hydrolase